ncbi:unnamed protein product [Orchesella dallaii]|uniref:Ribosome-binding factor A, mitochondrial n=1 Tax=Orchesella dallaii TaxID=48710 RepID=A0ABP1RTQ1_9HEXA
MFSSRLPIPKALTLVSRCSKNCLPQRDVIQIDIRPVSTSCACRSNSKLKFETGRQARMMKKLITGSNRSRKKFYTVEQPVSNTFSEFDFVKKGVSSQKAAPVSGKVLRRMEVLNALFMEQITSLLATGEVSPDFLGMGIQISKVKVTSNFSAVNVYWHASGTETNEVIEQLLARAAGHLRHELSQLRVIGIVPPIQFFRDKTFAKLQDVETLLNKIDLEPEFEETPSSESFTTASPKPKTKGGWKRDRAGEISDTDASVDETAQGIPEEDNSNVMRQDMLGIRHDVIMNEIMKTIQAQKDRKAAQARQQVEIRSISDEYNYDEAQHTEGPSSLDETADTKSDLKVENYRDRQREFLKYLKKRQTERSKEIRRQSTEKKEKEFILSEAEERWSKSIEDRIRLIEENIEDHEEDNDYYDYEEDYYTKLRQDFRDDSYKH